MGELLRRRAMMAGDNAIDPIDQYVTDGLVLWLDGIKNTRSGHDPSSAKWEDLSGNLHDYSYYSTRIIGENYCVPNGWATSASALTFPSVWTIEVVAQFVRSGTSQMVVPQGGNKKTVWISTGGNFVFGASSGNRYISMGTGVNTFNSLEYVNGVKQSFSNDNTSFTSTYATHLFGYSNATYHKFKSKVYALRLYNRTLTQDEILQNYNADKIRFNSGV